jgi:xanthine dehydrogenase accessory factor
VLQRYGVGDNDAFAVGLTCGGILDVFVEKVSQQTFPELADIAADIQAGRPVAVATVVEHPDAVRVGMRMIVRPAEDSPIIGSMGSPRADAAVADDVRGLLAAGKTELLTYGPDGQRRGEGMRVFAASYAPPPRMLVLARSTSQRPSPGSAVSWDIG